MSSSQSTLSRTSSYFTRPTQLLIAPLSPTISPTLQSINPLFSNKNRTRRVQQQSISQQHLSHHPFNHTILSIQQQSDAVKPTHQLSYIGKKRRAIKEWCHNHTGLIVICLILIILCSIFMSIIYALLIAPIFMTCMVVCTFLCILFVMTESSSWGYWHHNREAESRFWSMIGMLFVASLLFAPDSICPIGLQFPTLGIVSVFCTAVYINHYDRALEREQLIYTPQIMRNNSTDSNTHTQNAKDKLAIVTQAVHSLDYKFVGAKLINQYDIRKNISTILDTIINSNTEELNYIVTNANLALLFYKIKDRDIMVLGSGSLLNRSKVLKLLAEDRLNELNVHSRACVLDALMRMKLTAHTNAELWVRNIIVGTNSYDLTKLKNMTDNKGRFYNLHKLIFKDITNVAIRQEILAHIKLQALLIKQIESKQQQQQTANVIDISNNSILNTELPLTRSTSNSETHNNKPILRRKILSDVDDTLFSSGGRFPAGLDTSYTHHVIYPGVLTFYRELELGEKDEYGIWSDNRIGNLTFLSARPHVYKDKSELKTYQLFDQLRTTSGMHCSPTLLAGALDSGIRMFTGDYTPLAINKFDNFVAYTSLYPEYNFIFVGDNGQGDVICAEKMYDYIKDSLSAIFIHIVQPIHKTPGYNLTSEQRWKDMNIHFFYTYVHAALIAYKLNLLHLRGLRRIVYDVHIAFNGIKQNQLSYDIESRRNEFNCDIERVNQHLDSIHESPVPYIYAEQQYYVDALVMTPYGQGTIVSFEPVNAIYDVILHTWILSNGQSPHAYVYYKYIAFFTYAQPGTLVSTPYGIGLVQNFRSSDGQHEILLEWNATAYLRAQQLTIIPAAVTEKVKTKYGIGTVENYRRNDNMYEIHLSYGILYMSADDPSIQLVEADRSSCSIM